MLASFIFSYHLLPKTRNLTMKAKKIIGWALLTVGLLLIFWTLYSTYNIFTVKEGAPEIFKIEKQALPKEENKTNFASPEELQDEMKKIIEEQIKETIPPELISKLLNLISWSVFASILIFGGSRISGIGIKLIKGE